MTSLVVSIIVYWELPRVLLCFRKSRTSVHNAPNRSQRRGTLRVICTCIMGYGHLGAISVAAVSVNRRTLKITCYCTSVGARIRRSSNRFQTIERPKPLDVYRGIPVSRYHRVVPKQRYQSFEFAVKRYAYLPCGIVHRWSLNVILKKLFIVPRIRLILFTNG